MKKNEPVKKENRLEKVIVFLLVVLISLLSFSVGVISGKGLSDKEYALKSFDQKYSHALNEESKEEKSADADLSEEEIQQLANAAIQAAEKNGTAGDIGADEGEKVGGGAATSTVTAKTGTDSAAKGGTKVMASTTEEERFPSSVKKGIADTEFTVQVAAYPTIKDAETLSASLVKKGFPAFPFKVTVNGTEWYRVSVGSFKTRKEASDYQADLKKQGVVKDAVVQKLTK